MPKSDRRGISISAGWKRQHGGKDMPSNWRSPPRPGEKSPEQGRSYNRHNRENDRRREGGGWSVVAMKRSNVADVLHLLKLMLKANGQRGVPQGGVISPLLSNLYLNEVDRMLERAKRHALRQVHLHRVRTICR